MTYAKAVVACLGSGVTAALGLIPPRATLWIVLTVASAMLTTASVYLTPNIPPTGQGTHRLRPNDGS